MIGRVFKLVCLVKNLKFCTFNCTAAETQPATHCQIVQKRHQEQISGPLDTVEAAPLAKDLPPPTKRFKFESQKARENRAQSELSQVLFRGRSIKNTTSKIKSSPARGIDTSSSQRNLSPFSQNSFTKIQKSRKYQAKKKE